MGGSPLALPGARGISGLFLTLILTPNISADRKRRNPGAGVGRRARTGPDTTPAPSTPCKCFLPAAQLWGSGLGWFVCDRLPPFVPLRLGSPQGHGLSEGLGAGHCGWPEASCRSGPSGHQCGLRRRESTSHSIWLWAGRWLRDSIQNLLSPGSPAVWTHVRMGLRATSNLVLAGDGEEPRAWQRGHFPGPEPSSQGWHTVSCPSGFRGGVLVILLRLAGPADGISSPLSLSKAPSCQAISGRDQDGPPGKLPKAFSLVPLGKDPEKD